MKGVCRMAYVPDPYENRSVWRITADTLLESGIRVFPPATALGECRKEYVVLKRAGSVQLEDYSTERVYYMFILYVPRDRYTMLDELESKVKGVLRERLYPMLLPTGLSNNDGYDENVNAHYRAFTYQNKVRNRSF